MINMFQLKRKGKYSVNKNNRKKKKLKMKIKSCMIKNWNKQLQIKNKINPKN